MFIAFHRGRKFDVRTVDVIITDSRELRASAPRNTDGNVSDRALRDYRQIFENMTHRTLEPPARTRKPWSERIAKGRFAISPDVLNFLSLVRSNRYTVMNRI
jgi:hypothetical protein